jgi:hypothetical protein
MEQLEIIVPKTGGIWHGTIKAFPRAARQRNDRAVSGPE